MTSYWLLVAEMTGTGQGAGQKWYVTLYGSDWADSAGRVEASFSNYNMNNAGSTILTITESEVYYTHPSLELLNCRTWRAVRRNSDDMIRIYVQFSTSANYSTLNATAKYQRSGFTENSTGDFATYKPQAIAVTDTANFWSGTGYTVLTTTVNRGSARYGAIMVDTATILSNLSANNIYPYKLFIRGASGTYDNGIEWINSPTNVIATVPSGSTGLSIYRADDNSRGKISLGVGQTNNYIEALNTGNMTMYGAGNLTFNSLPMIS